GFEAKELAEANGMTSAEHRRLHRRLQTIINRLQRGAANQTLPNAENERKPPANSIQSKKMLSQAVNSSGEVPFSNSEKGFSPEPSRLVPQIGSHVAA